MIPFKCELKGDIRVLFEQRNMTLKITDSYQLEVRIDGHHLPFLPHKGLREHQQALHQPQEPFVP